MNNELERSVGTWDTITKKGNTYFRFRRTYGNERKEFTGKTKKDVMKKVNEYESNPVTRIQKDTLALPLHKYVYECGVYWATIKRMHDPKPNKAQSDTINRLKKSKLGKTQLGSITPILITQYITTLNNGDYARKTINADLATIKRCLNRAVEEGLISKNPACEVAPLREEEMVKKSRQSAYLEIEDMKKLIKEANRVNTIDCQINGPIGSRVYGVNADVVCFLLYTGLRIGECLALTWDDIIYRDGEMAFLNIKSSLKEEKDVNGETIYVRGTTKTKSSVRMVSINKHCKSILEAQRRKRPDASNSDFIFLSEEGTPILYRNVNRVLKSMLKRAHCSNTKATAHSLRHTYGSYLIANGASVYNVSKLLGHSSVATTERVYLHLLTKSNEDTSSLIDNLDID